MNLSKQTSDSIQMLACCYRAGDELVKVANIADELGLTKQMALKLANVLSQLDLVQTYRGPSGGIRLTSDAKTATLGQIVRQLERAPERRSATPQARLEGFIDEAFEAFLEVLDRNRLEDIAVGGQQPTTAGPLRSNQKTKKVTRKKRGSAVAATSPREL